MKKIYVSLVLIVAIIIGIFGTINNSFAIELQNEKLSQKYKEWLELDEDERETTIAPLPFNIREKELTGIEKINTIIKQTELPSKYDLRQDIDIEVKNQLKTGLCWGFSANSCIETNIALKTGNQYNFSERHLEYNTAYYLEDKNREESLHRTIGAGGNVATAFTYYSRGSGPILEEDMPFENNEFPLKVSQVPTNVTVTKIDDMIYFPNIYKFKDGFDQKYLDANGKEYTELEVIKIRNAIKQHIMENGAISANIASPKNYYNSDTCAEYDNKSTKANHSVTIIGWDDNYSKENFLYYNKPMHDGAYIVLNSWGEDWGDSGYFYVSYEDNLIESGLRGVTNISNIEYDNIYQYDYSSMYGYKENKYGANLFTAREDEILTEIMVGSPAEQICNIYANIENGNLEISQSIKIANNVTLKPGYNTIKLEEEINLIPGNKFAIIVELLGENFVGIGDECNILNSDSNAVSHKGESYVSNDGTIWADIFNSSDMMNLCIKAYTKTKQEEVEIISRKYSNKVLFEGIEGEAQLIFKTPVSYEGKQITVYVFDSSNNVTSSFVIPTNIHIKDRYGRVNIKVPDDISKGNYTIKIMCDSKIILEHSLVIIENNYDSNIYTKIKFDDLYLYNALKRSAIKDNNIFAYFDDKQELIVYKYLAQIDLSADKYKSSNIMSVGNGYNVTNIDGIEKFATLETLILSGNPIKDLKPIENMTSLKKLTIYNGFFVYQGIEWNNIIENIDVVRNLTNLKKLTITDSNIENIDFIKSLDKLETLDLQGNPISDISAVKDLNNLTYLCLQRCNIENIDVIEYLDKLNFLDLQVNKIEDATIIDNKFKNTGANILLNVNIIEKKIKLEEEGDTIIEVPKIIEQACDENSLLYAPDGIVLDGCEWVDYGKTIKVNKLDSMIRVSSSGVARGTRVNLTRVSGIYIKTLPKQKYFLGEQLDLTGGILEFIDNDGKIEEINMNDSRVKVTGYNSNELGEQTLTVEYNGNTTLFKIKVSKQVKSISIYQEPDKTVYVLGEKLETFGGKIKVIYKDDTEEILDLDESGIEIDGYNRFKMGNQVVKITYGGQEATFEVNVINEVVEIQIVEYPKKLVYDLGEELDLTGTKIKVIRQDGSTGTTNLTNLFKGVTGYDKNKEGQQEVTITYEGKTATFNVIVENNVKKITIKNAPVKTTYKKGEDLEIDGGIIEIEYKNGTTREVEMLIEMVSGYKKDQEGEQVLTVTYGGQEATFNVIVTGANEDTTWQNEYYYKLNEEKSTIKLIEYIGTNTELVVPGTAVVNGKTYTTELKECDSFTTIWGSNIVKISFEEGIILPSDCSDMFNGCKGLIELDISKFDTSNVTDMSAMFYECPNLTKLDVSNFNTSKVFDMSYMFRSCSSLTQLDVSKFDTKNVTNMRVMFYECSNLTELDVSKFDTSKVTDMELMFCNCKKLTQLDVSNFNTSKVEDMISMFEYCNNLTQIDVSNFDTSNVKYIMSMFSNCAKLKELDLSSFDLTNAGTTKSKYSPTLFQGCDSLNIIKAPLNIPNGVEHPLDDTYEILDDEGKPTGTTTTILPQGLTKTVTLRRKTGTEEGLYVRFISVTEENGFVKGIQPNTIISKIKSKEVIETNGEIEILKGNEKIETGTGLVCTGYKLKVTKGTETNGIETKEYTLVVKGDCDGNGKADFKDMLKINKHRLNKVKLQGAFLEAGELTGDNKVDFKDMLRINKFRLNKIDAL